MNDLFDSLEICLQELETGADLETVLARYPDLASELRPILKASIAARMMSSTPVPSPEAVHRGRAKLLQRASEMREGKLAPRKRMIPIFQRLAISFALTAAFLTTGTGLVGASSSALPGERLYPVKLTWENMRLFFTFNNEYRESLENSFEDERLKEVGELLSEGKNETIHFVGIYTQVNGVAYVSGIHIVLLDTSILPIEPLQAGMAVIVTGHTNAQKFVDVESIKLLPAGSAVPTGEPVEIELNHNDGGESGNINSNENGNANTNENVNTNNNESVNENGNDNTSDSSHEGGDDSVNSNSGSNDDSSGDSVNSNSGSNDDSSGDSVNSNNDGNDSSGDSVNNNSDSNDSNGDSGGDNSGGDDSGGDNNNND